MFDNVGRSLDEEANKRKAQSLLLTVGLFGLAAGVSFAWAAWTVKEFILEPQVLDESMVEVVMDDPALEEAPPPPPPPPPPAAAAQEEEEEEEEEDEPETPQPDVMQEDVADLDKDIEDKLKNEDVPKGVEGGQEGGVEGGDLEHGVLGGDPDGVPGGQLNGNPGPRTFHHSEVQTKKDVPLKYPDSARDLSLGDVSCLARIYIDEEGVPYDVVVESCPNVFHAGARASLLQWRWYPAKFEGKKVKAQFLIRINYKAPR